MNNGDTVGIVGYDAVINTDTLRTSGAKAESMAQGVADNISKGGSKAFQNFAANASSSFGSIADSISSAAVKLAIFTAGGSLGIGTFVKSAADLQQTSKSFEVLIGNTEIANGLFAQLARYANNTPFEFPEIAKAGQTLLGFGITSDQVFDRIKTLGDIAAATGAEFGSLSVVYGQVNAAGKLYGQDALQLINNSIPIYNILAKKMGVETSKVKEKIEDGAVSAKIFNEALADVTKEGGFAFGGVDTLAQSFNGRMSTLKDTVLEFGRNLIGVKVDPELGLVVQQGGVFDRLSQLLPKIGDELQKIKPYIQGAFEWILNNGDTVKGILAGITAAFVAAKLAAIGFAIAAAANPIGAVAVAITVLIGALTYLQVKFGIITQALEYLQPVIKAVKDMFAPLIAQLRDELAPIIDWIGGHLELLKNIAIVLAAFFAGPFIVAAGLVVGAIYLIVAAVTAAISIFNGLINIGLAVKNTLTGNFTDAKVNIINAFQELGQALPAPFKYAFNQIAKYWNATLGKINISVPSWVPGVGGNKWNFPDIPQLADGGIIMPRPGGTLANIAEAGKPEAVIPLDKLNDLGGGGVTVQLNMSGVMTSSRADLRTVARDLVSALDEELRAKGQPTILRSTA